MEASSTSPNFPDSFSLTFYLEATVSSSSSLKVVEIYGLIVNSPSKYIVEYRDFVSRFISLFFSKISVYSKDLYGEKTYWGIDSYVVEAKAVKLSNGVEYRETNTGLYLGGRYKEKYSVVLYRVVGRVTINYEFDVFVLLKKIEPQIYINSLNVINIPVDLIKWLLLFFAAAITLISLHVLMNWKKYRIV